MTKPNVRGSASRDHRKFMLVGEFPETHEQWVESIERSKRKDTVECSTHDGVCNRAITQ
jgi:hypothetical protein